MLTFVVPQEMVPIEDHEALYQALQFAAGQGEPWLTFFQPDALRSQFHDPGFAWVHYLTPAEANDRYFPAVGMACMCASNT